MTAIGGNIDVTRATPNITDLPAIGSRARANAQNAPTIMEVAVALAATTMLFASDRGNDDLSRTRS
jgi:hypothetical protein